MARPGIATTALLLLTPAFAFAQPVWDTVGTRASRTTGGFEDIRATGRRLTLDDADSRSIPIGFAFTSYGRTHTSVHVTSEGYLTFQSGPVVEVPTALPNSTAPNALIAAFWANLDLDGLPTATVHYATLGSAPDRRLVVQWTDVPLQSDSGARLTFQVALFEDTQRIELRYLSMKNGDGSEGTGAASGLDATLGIESEDGAVALQLAHDVAGTVRGGDRFVIEPGPLLGPRLGLRSGVAAPGNEIELALDLAGPLTGVTNLQATLTISGPVAVRSVTPELGGQAAVSPDLATTGPVTFSFPLDLPQLVGTRTVARIKLIVLPGASVGDAFNLTLTNVALSGSAQPTPVDGTLTVGAVSPAQVDTLRLSVPAQVTGGSGVELAVLALGQSQPIPNVPVTLWIGNPAAVSLTPLSGLTGVDGRLRVQLDGQLQANVARSLLVATSPGLSDDARTIVRVVPPTPPAISSDPVVTAHVATRYQYAVTGTAGLVYVLEKAPPGMTIDAGGTIHWVPRPTQLGAFEVVVRAQDAAPSQSFTVLVTPAAPQTSANRPPSITSSPASSSVEVGAVFSYDVDASDPDGDPITYSVEPPLAGLSIDASSGALQWTPAAEHKGQRQLLILAADPRGGLDAQTVTLTVAPTTGNGAPSITTTPPGSAPLGQEYLYDPAATDPENDSLTWVLLEAPQGLTVDPASGQVRWIAATDLGAAQRDPVALPSVTVRLQVDDSAGNSTPHTFSLQLQGGPVVEVWPATVAFGPVRTGDQARAIVLIDNTGTLPLRVDSATLQGGDPAPFGVRLLVVGGEVVAEVTFDPTVQAASATDLVLTTSAGTTTVPLTGQGIAPANPATPIISTLPSLRAVVGREWVYQPKATDPAGGGLTWALVNPPVGMSIHPLSGTLRWTPQANQTGLNQVEVTATDSSSQTGRQRFWVVGLQIGLSVSSRPDRTAPGVNEHEVVVDVSVSPTRDVVTSLGPIGRLMVEHVLPGDGTPPLELVVGSANPQLQGTKVSPQGYVLTWAIPATSTRLVHTVKAHDQAAGSPRPLSVETRARLLSGADVLTLQTPWALLRTLDSATPNPTGLGVDAPTDTLLVVGSDATVRRIAPDGSLLGSEAIGATSAAPAGLDAGMLTGRVAVLDPTAGRLFELGLASSTLLRSTRTDGIATALDGVAVDLDGSQRFFLSRANHELYRLGRSFGDHVAAPNGNVRAVAGDPSGDLWAVDRTANLVYRLNDAGAVLSSFGTVANANGVTVHGASGNLLVISSDDRLYEYTPAGALVKSTRVEAHVSEAVGITRDPSSGELILVDAATDELIRLGANLGSQVPMPWSTNAVGVTRDPTTGHVYTVDRTGDSIHRLSSSGALLNSWPLGSGNTGPDGIAFREIAGAAHLFVMDSGGRLYEYRIDGSDQLSMVRWTNTSALANNPRGVAWDPSSSEWIIVDSGLDRAVRLGGQLGQHVALPGTNPQAVSWDAAGNQLWLVDSSSDQVYSLDPAGNVLSQFGVALQSTTSDGIAWDAARGTVQVAENNGTPRIYEYTPSGALLRSTRIGFHSGATTGITRDPVSGELLIVDDLRDGVVRLGTRFGDHVSLAALPSGPSNTTGITRVGGDLFVVDTTLDQVLRLDASGTSELGAFGLPAGRYEGLAFDPLTGNLMVLDANGLQALEYTTGGTLVRALRLDHYVVDPTGLTVDPASGDLVLVDLTLQKIVRIDSSVGSGLPLSGLSPNTTGIARDPSTPGTYWMVDADLDAVVKIGPGGAVIPGGFSVASDMTDPQGVSYSAAGGGRLLVIDAGSRRLYEYDLAGNLLRHTRVDAHASSPTDVLVDPASGEVLLVDDGLDRVVRLGAQLGSHDSLLFGAPWVAATNATGVTADPGTGELWVVDAANDRVSHLSAAGVVLDQFAVNGTPTGIARQSNGELLVLDGALKTVTAHTAGGTPVAGSTRALPFTTTPTGIAALGAEWFVSDSGSLVLHRVDPASGAQLGTLAVPAGCTNPTDVVADPNGDLAILDAGSGRIWIVDTSGALVRDLSVRAFGAFAVEGLAWDGTSFRVTETTDDRLFSLAPGGLPLSSFSTTSIDPSATEPVGLAVAADPTRLVLVDAASDAVYLIESDGTYVDAFSTAAYGSFAPTSLVYDPDMALYQVPDADEDLLFAMAPGGIQAVEIDTTSFGSSDPRDIGMSADGSGFVVVDYDGNQSAATVFEVTAGGALIRSFSAQAYGAFRPSGVVWDGAAYRVTDTGDDSLFAMDPGGLAISFQTSADTTWPTWTTNPQDVAVGPNGDLIILDGTSDQVIRITAAGQFVSAFSTRDFGVFAPIGVTWDGQDLRVTDNTTDRLFTMSIDGLPSSSFNTRPFGAASPSDVTLAPNGTNLVISDNSDDLLYEVTPTGTLVGTVNARHFGSFAPLGLVFDGTRYLVVDNGEDALFFMDPGGLPVTRIPTAPAPISADSPEDVVVHPARGTLFLINGTDFGDELIELDPDGSLVARHDLHELGIRRPMGLGVDAAGDLRISDIDEDRLFRVAPDGPGLSAYDLAAKGVSSPEGVAFDPATRSLFVSTDTHVYQLCVTPSDVQVMGSLTLADFGITAGAEDVSLDRSRGELYVVADDGLIYVFALPPGGHSNPGKVLLLVEGDAAEVPFLLQGQGHTVVHSALTPGALAAALDSSFTQVWILNGRAPGTMAGLDASDLAALDTWRASTGRDGLVVDALGWRTHATCSQLGYTTRLVNVLEDQGGGLLLATGPEQSSLANPADGSGQVVATANQVLAHLGFQRLTGAYVTPDSSLFGGGDLVAALPDFAAGSVEHAEAPFGPMPNGQTLYPSLGGVYTSQTGSAALPNGEVHLLVSTFPANEPNATAVGLSATAESIVTIIPLVASSRQDGSSVYILTATNLNDTEVELLLTPQGLSAPDFVTALHQAITLQPLETRYLVLSVDVAATAPSAQHAFAVQVDEVLPTSEVRARGQAAASLWVFPNLVPLTLSIAPTPRVEASGVPLSYSLTLTNPQAAAATFDFEVFGEQALGSGEAALAQVALSASQTTQVPLTLTPTAEPGDYYVTVRVTSSDPAVLPGLATAKLSLGPTNQPPLASAGADRMVPSPSGAPVSVTLDGTGSLDPEGAALTWTWTGPGGSSTGATPVVSLAPGTHTFSLVVSDGVHTSAPDTVEIVVGDSQGPLVGPQVIVVEQANQAGTPVDLNAQVVISDDAGAGWILSCNPASGSTFPLGDTPVLCTATDASGNASAPTTITVRVVDTTPPVLTQPTDITVVTNDPGQVVTFPAPQVSDNCDSSPAVTCVPPSGTWFAEGTHTVTCTAQDSSGNSAQATFLVTVIRNTDQTPPVLAVTTPTEGALTGIPGTVAVVLTFADEVGGSGIDTSSLTVSVDGVDRSALFQATATATGASASFTLLEGAHEIRATITDVAGNTSVEVVRTFVVDLTPPVITLQSPTQPVVVEQSDRNGTPLTLVASVTDNDPNPTLADDAPATFPLGTTQVTFTGTDAAGNVATLVVPVTVQDTTPPTLTAPADVVVEQATGAGTVVSYTPPTASDVCDASPTVTCAPAPGTTFPLGATTVTCTAQDASGNSRQVSFTITVRDTTAPSITAPANVQNVEATGSAGAQVTFPAPVVSDVCDASPTVTCSPASGATFPLGTTQVTCTGTDASGNSASDTFLVSVVDTTPPSLPTPSDVTVEQRTAAGTVVTFPAPTATDLVDPNPTVTCTPPSGTTFPLGTTTVTCVARDSAGNTSQVTFDVIVEDTTVPTLVDPADMTVPSQSPQGAVVTYPPPQTSDLCDASPSVVLAPPSGSLFPIGTTTVTCSSTDASGNVALVTFDVTVQALGDQPPVIGPTPDVVVEQADRDGTRVDYPLPTVSDDRDPNPTLTCEPPPGTVFPLGHTTVTCTAVDSAGNTSTRTFTVVVQDTRAPVFALSFCDRQDYPVGRKPKALATGDLNGDGRLDVVTANFGANTITVRLGRVGGGLGERRDVAASYCPTAVALGDLDGDGRLDALVANFGAKSVSVFLGLGDGRFAKRRDVRVGRQPSGIGLGDFDGDGHLDAAVSLQGERRVVILRGDGQGGLEAPSSGSTGASSPRAVVAVELTGDGLLDLATVGSDGCRRATATRFAGDGAGGVGERLDLRLRKDPRSLAAADVDGDGDVDLAVADFGANTVTILVNDGQGVFDVGATLRTGACPSGITAADLSGDGRVDLAVTNFGSNTATVYHGDGRGGFTRTSNPRTGACPSAIVHGDFDGDGRLDLALTNYGSGTVSILRNCVVEDVEVEQATADGTVVRFAVPRATDICDADPQVVCEPPSGSVFPLGVTQVECRATDASGNTRSLTFEIIVRDTRPPRVGRIRKLVVEAQDPAGAVVVFERPPIEDVCDARPAVVFDPPSGSVFRIGCTRVACTVTDASGNATRVRFKVYVRDRTPPEIDLPGDVVLEQASRDGTPLDYVATATDLVDPRPRLTCRPAPGSIFALGTTVVSCKARDSAGNTTRRTFRVTVRDTRAPVFAAALPDLTVEQQSSAGAEVALAAPTVRDVCDARPDVTFDPPGGVFPAGETRVTCSATDDSGNTSRVTFRVTVQDTRPPSIGLPADLDLEVAPGQSTTASSDPRIVAWLGSATASDQADPAPRVVHDAPARFGAETVVTFTAIDAAGNTASGHATLRLVAAELDLVVTPDGLCTPDPVQLQVQAPGAKSVSVSGTWSRTGLTRSTGSRTVFEDEGDYRVEVRAQDPQGDVLTRVVTFSIDRSAPRVDLRSPGTCRLQVRRKRKTSLTIPIAWKAHDRDGIRGGVARRRLTLDGAELPVSTRILTLRTFRERRLPVLGRHVLEARATDCAGNTTTVRVAFRVRLRGDCQVRRRGAWLDVVFRLPTSPTGSPLDPTFRDLRRETLRLSCDRSRRRARAVCVELDDALGQVVVRFRRADLEDELGEIGRVRLSGRFRSSTGPLCEADEDDDD